MEQKDVRALFERVQRIEARMVRGFTELGVVVTDDDGWCRIDHGKHTVHLKGGGKSFKAVQIALLNDGARTGDVYEVSVAGIRVGSVIAL